MLHSREDATLVWVAATRQVAISSCPPTWLAIQLGAACVNKQKLLVPQAANKAAAHWYYSEQGGFQWLGVGSLA
jgi:hypothetical protein